MDFTVMGDGVNLASRIEGLCKAYAVPYLISDDTLRAARSSYRSREVDRVVVKGRVAPVVVHELLDHYDEESFPNMLDALAAYRDGQGYYAERRFEDAIRYFERARELNPADRLPSVYIDRCRHFESEPPPAGWNGVWVMKTK
jgi:adenylate cyclase